MWIWAALAFSITPPSRGVIALSEDKGVTVSWRLSTSDSPGTKFDVFRRAPTGTWKRINATPITGATQFLDRDWTGSAAVQYTVAPAAGPKSTPFTLKPAAYHRPYLSIPLKPLPGYTANDGSVGDLDGDGELELVVHRTGRGKDNSQSGETDPPILEAYRLDGTFLWRIQLGKNIREGAHYTQFLVYDFDGDGKAEVVCKTADGTVDGTGKVLGNPKADFRNERGYVLAGPEKLTVFEGSTGRALSTVDYVPPRNSKTMTPSGEDLKAGWGDAYGNRVDRFLACVAYLDGRHPSIIMTRGYYTRIVAAAWDWNGKHLRQRWVFDTDDGTPGNKKFRGQGNHNLAVADVDGDGKDDIIFGSCTIGSNGKGIYSTGLGHGDAVHVSKLDPSRSGLQVFAIHEHTENHGGVGVTLRDARTGEILWKKMGPDVGRGLIADIDPRFPGSESWAVGQGLTGLWDVHGSQISTKHPKSCNFTIWWDGDLLRELLDKNQITKWNWNTESDDPLLAAEGCVSNNTTKATPVLSADILGDWREEVIWRTADDKELRIYSSTISTSYRIPWLMEDHVYQLGVAWQNIGYNQPPYLSTTIEEWAKPYLKP